MGSYQIRHKVFVILMGFVDIMHYTMKKDGKVPKMLDENNSMQHTLFESI